MQNLNDIGDVLNKTTDERRSILKSRDEKTIRYFMSIIDLLATCCEGENKAVESMCHTLYSFTDLLDILNDTNILNIIKRPFLRFFHWAYMHTGFSSTDLEIEVMSHP